MGGNEDGFCRRFVVEDWGGAKLVWLVAEEKEEIGFEGEEVKLLKCEGRAEAGLLRELVGYFEK